METKEWKTIDKKDWPRGEWDDEPDKKQWPDKETGLSCLLVRNAVGALCGYVGVPPGHPAHGKDYDDVDVEIHGGLTFASPCQDFKEVMEKGVCHIPDEGDPDNVWWLGFDCCHCFDLSPNLSYNVPNQKYRNVAYVEAECRKLAEQLHETAASPS